MEPTGLHPKRQSHLPRSPPSPRHVARSCGTPRPSQLRVIQQRRDAHDAARAEYLVMRQRTARREPGSWLGSGATGASAASGAAERKRKDMVERTEGKSERQKRGGMRGGGGRGGGWGRGGWERQGGKQGSGIGYTRAAPPAATGKRGRQLRWRQRARLAAAVRGTTRGDCAVSSGWRRCARECEGCAGEGAGGEGARQRPASQRRGRCVRWASAGGRRRKVVSGRLPMGCWLTGGIACLAVPVARPICRR